MAHNFQLSASSEGKNVNILNHFMDLPQNNKVQAEYIWIGGSGLDLRSKTKTLSSPVRSVKDLPEWNFDGSSTGQAKGSYSEVWLRPVKYCIDPFRLAPNILVLCECLNAKTMQPLSSNTRAAANKIFLNEKVKNEVTWFGIEQEYTLFDSDGKTPLGWPKNGFPAPQGPYYCGIGTRSAYGRHLVECHYRACLYAGLDISGINAEVMAGQWEFQIGPCVGIDSGDQVWLARYILTRVAEDFGVCVSFAAKPIAGDWNGAGAHTNYSTKSMRTSKDDIKNDNNNKNDISEDNNNNNEEKHFGFDAIIDAIKKLEVKHLEHMKSYGKGNQKRLLGTHETAKYDEFSYGVAHRGASVRIPRMCELEGCGYLEDRRPAANCDPYDVTSLIAQTTILS